SADPPDKKALLYYNVIIVRKDFVLSTKMAQPVHLGSFVLAGREIPANGVFFSLERNSKSYPSRLPLGKRFGKKGAAECTIQHTPRHPFRRLPAYGSRKLRLSNPPVTGITAPVMKSASGSTRN